MQSLLRFYSLGEFLCRERFVHEPENRQFHEISNFLEIHHILGTVLSASVLLNFGGPAGGSRAWKEGGFIIFYKQSADIKLNTGIPRCHVGGMISEHMTSSDHVVFSKAGR